MPRSCALSESAASWLMGRSVSAPYVHFCRVHDSFGGRYRARAEARRKCHGPASASRLVWSLAHRPMVWWPCWLAWLAVPCGTSGSGMPRVSGIARHSDLTRVLGSTCRLDLAQDPRTSLKPSWWTNVRHVPIFPTSYTLRGGLVVDERVRVSHVLSRSERQTPA